MTFFVVENFMNNLLMFLFSPEDDKCHNTRCAFGCVQYMDGFQCFCPDGLKVTWDGLGCEGRLVLFKG